MKNFFIIFGFITLFYSCSTDIDLNADYKDITVVYGLLDKNTEHQYIKVNKTFLGNAAVADMAQVSDSFIYKTANVSLIKYHNDNYVETINFEYCDTIKKDEGFFANDKNVIYISNDSIITSAEEKNLDEYSYKLIVKIPNKPEVSAETKLVSDVKLMPPISTRTEIIFYNYGTKKYIDPTLKFRSAKNALLYEIYVEMAYYEKEYGSTDYNLKKIYWQQLNKRSTSIDGDENIDATISGGGFYSYFHNNLSGTNIEERVFYSLRFYFVTAGEILTKYIDLTTPDYGLVQEKPSFTNVENGWGLFSSRSSTFSKYKKLESASLQHLSNGTYTKNDKFIPANEISNFYAIHQDLDPQYLYNTAP